MRLRIASRSSLLAKTQSYLIADALKKKDPSLQFEFQFRESLGDKNLQDPLWKLPQKGVFTEDFLDDLKTGRADAVVHSWKDLPTEPRSHTQIVATLARDDQRDLFLLKKAAAYKPLLKIFSSSPRRSHNLSRLLPDFVPWKCATEFLPVRGNVQTRLRKMQDQVDIDGMILAKAALDRLLAPLPQHLVIEESNYLEEQRRVAQFIREVLETTDWMVLPLSVNPNAAAQGAIAVEIRKDRDDLADLFSSVSHAETFRAAVAERNLLSQFGGGCHLSLGMTVLQREYGQITWVQGTDPAGNNVSRRILDRPVEVEQRWQALRKKKIWVSSELEDYVHRNPRSLAGVLPSRAIYVARAEALHGISVRRPENGGQLFGKNADLPERPLRMSSSLPNTSQNLVSDQGNADLEIDPDVVWSSGLKTWKKLAERGIWCHGSSEGLGESEDPRVDLLVGAKLNWQKWTHAGTHGASPGMAARNEVSMKDVVEAYELDLRGPLSPEQTRQIREADLLFWMSPQHFSFVDSQIPNTLIHKEHACGPGQTRSFLREKLGRDPLIFLSSSQATEFFSERK